MTREELRTTIEAERQEYYRWVASLILSNPRTTLAALRETHDITSWAMHRARQMFNIRRKPGRGSSTCQPAVCTDMGVSHGKTL